MGGLLRAGAVQRPCRAVWWGGGCCGQAVEELLDIHADVALHDADVQNARGLHPSVRSTIVVLPVRCEPAHALWSPNGQQSHAHYLHRVPCPPCLLLLGCRD